MPSVSASTKKGSEQLQGFKGSNSSVLCRFLKKVTKLHANTGSWISLYANLLLLSTGNINFIGIFCWML